MAEKPAGIFADGLSFYPVAAVRRVVGLKDHPPPRLFQHAPQSLTNYCWVHPVQRRQLNHVACAIHL